MLTFEMILKLFKDWNGRHPEYNGTAQLCFYSDGLGVILDGQGKSIGIGFKGQRELLYVLNS
jgi:hypothetical protein